MKRTNANAADHPELPGLFRPTVHIPAVVTSDGCGGYHVRPGKPVVTCGSDEIGTAEAARLLGYSQSWVSQLCDQGSFKTCRKKGPSDKASWLIQRAEVMAYLPTPPKP